MINNAIGVHPMALLSFDTMDADPISLWTEKMRGYASLKDFHAQRIAEDVAASAASVYPMCIIVYLSDLASNEYMSLSGSERCEPGWDNPMSGFRGCSRDVGTFPR